MAARGTSNHVDENYVTMETLKAELRIRGLPTNGKKADLMARLVSSLIKVTQMNSSMMVNEVDDKENLLNFKDGELDNDNLDTRSVNCEGTVCSENSYITVITYIFGVRSQIKRYCKAVVRKFTSCSNKLE